MPDSPQFPLRNLKTAIPISKVNNCEKFQRLSEKGSDPLRFKGSDPFSDSHQVPDELRILSERDKTGKGRLPNVGYLRGIRIPEIEQKSAKTAAFSVSVAVTVSRLLQPDRLNMLARFCYTARDSQRECLSNLHCAQNRRPDRANPMIAGAALANSSWIQVTGRDDQKSGFALFRH